MQETEHGEQDFDKVVICSHGDEALAMLQNPSEFQVQVLSKFKYQKNEALVFI